MIVLITGGTGSLGQAIARRLCGPGSKDRPDKLCIYSRSELRQHEMVQDFLEYNGIRMFLGDVRDRSRLNYACENVDVLIHTAALKRVDAIAYNPTEVNLTNIGGTLNVVEAAIQNRVGKVLALSSDKACEPVNVYGASKAMTEHMSVYMNSFAEAHGTKISLVRYGNVLTSAGSAYHIFRKQIKDDVPFTLTHHDMTRFAITMDHAVTFILRCIETMRGGEIFVPILPSFFVRDMPKAMDPARDVQMIGLRPGGEKLAETLISRHETYRVVRHRYLNAFIINPTHADWNYKPWIATTHTGAFCEVVPDGFSYMSDTNPVFLNHEQLRTLLPKE